MRTAMNTQDELIKDLNIDDVLHGLGLELMMKSEELLYATPSLDEEECEKLGSDLYLLARVVGCILARHSQMLQTHRIELPEDVGVVRVKNPYYAHGSERPTDRAAGQSDSSGGELPF